MLNLANVSTFRNLRNGLTFSKMAVTMLMGSALSFVQKTVGSGEKQSVTKHRLVAKD